MPSGAMFMMVRVRLERFPQFETDAQLVEALMAKESVFCLSGNCFNFPGYLRIVLSVPTDLLEEALNRILCFCSEFCD